MAAGDRRTIQTPGGFTQIQEQRANGTWLIIKSTKVGSGSGTAAVTPPAGIVTEGGRKGAVAGSSGGRGDTSLLATPPPVVAPVVAPAPVTGPAAGGEPDWVRDMLDRFASTQDELRKVQAATLQLDQAFKDSQIRLQAAGEERLSTESLAKPGVNFASMFSQFRRAGEPVPLPPDIAALVEGQEIPGSGNLPGTGIRTVPGDADLRNMFRDALAKASSRTLQGMTGAQTDRFQTLGTLAGVDPLEAFERRMAAIPRASRVSGSLFAA